MARWLLQLHDRVPNDFLPVTQEALAQLLGVRRTTVTLTMSKLRQAGAVPSDPARICRDDPRARLERVACDCYALMQRKIDRMYCQELSEPQPTHAPFGQSAIVASGGAGESRAVSRAGK
ncbi:MULTISPECIES: helix-turn-helix domain-containing protein [unclassified Bradyrhizobium]|uniref:helix-turn-helix domain-containing protein n=1 Tax=unclassified Bradyrhizobium TaxID=2631580 RepID=UPI001FF70E37|nr:MULTISPECIES: helix-turn-helix domain-containing protein [unclassified Bradyrhizobium]